MPEGTIVFIVGATIVVVGLLAYIALSMRRTHALRARYGPEYEHLARTIGDKARVEKELDARERRVSRLHIRLLEERELGPYRDSWRSVQTQFVDDPRRAVAEADRLVQDVMNARGYPVGDFDQNAADISVDHPSVVMHYRAAHEVASRSAAGQASTEDLRQALIHYRALFDDLLETSESTVGRKL